MVTQRLTGDFVGFIFSFQHIYLVRSLFKEISIMFSSFSKKKKKSHIFDFFNNSLMLICSGYFE